MTYGKEEKDVLSIYLAILDNDADRELFGELYRRFYDKMMMVALRMLPSKPLAEDAVHDSFLKIIAHFEDLKAIPEDRRIYWIVSVTKNASIDLLRKERREVPVEDDDALTEPVSADEGEFHMLVDLIRSMPEGYRRVLELRFVAEWSHAEIAKELHISEGAVKTRVSRGRQMLIDRLKKEGYTCGECV